jgi:capsular exopolysaccharide synthesis family protein
MNFLHSHRDGMTVDLRDYVRTLRKRWTLVALCVLVSLGAAAAATLLAKQMYTSTAQIFVSARDSGDNNASNAYQGGLLAQQQVKTYSRVAVSPTVTDKVAARLQLEPGVVANSVTADAPLDTVLINVTATARSPKVAQQIAQAVADETSALVPRLETTEGKAAPVKLTVTTAANLPTSPSSPRPKINLALGLLVGIAIGVGAAVLRETLDTTVKGKDDLQEITGAAPLGVIADDPGVSRRPLVVQIDAQSPRAEAFRQLRTNLQFVDVDRATRAVVVTSAVAEEGKTTTSCNLAITLAQAGVRTVLVEADLRRPKLSDYLGIERAVGLTTVLTGVAALDEALQPWGRSGTMWVLPSGALPPNPSEILGSHQMQELLKTLDERADVVILDAPPLLPVTDAAVLARVADGAVLVVRVGRTKREQVARAIESLTGVDARLLGTVLNRAPARGPDADAYGYGYGYASTRGPRPQSGDGDVAKTVTPHSSRRGRRNR